jgi:hypothetical protein
MLLDFLIVITKYSTNCKYHVRRIYHNKWKYNQQFNENT